MHFLNFELLLSAKMDFPPFLKSKIMFFRYFENYKNHIEDILRLCDLGSRIIMNAVSLLTDDCVYLFIKGKKLSFAHNISFLEVGFCVLSNLFSKVTLLLFCRNIIIRSKNFLQIKSCP